MVFSFVKLAYDAWFFFGKSLWNITSSNSFPHFLYKFFPDLKSFCTFSPVLQVCPVALWNCPFEILHKFFYYHAKGKKCNCSQIKLSWSHICFVEKHALTSLGTDATLVCTCLFHILFISFNFNHPIDALLLILALHMTFHQILTIPFVIVTASVS